MRKEYDGTCEKYEGIVEICGRYEGIPSTQIYKLWDLEKISRSPHYIGLIRDLEIF